MSLACRRCRGSPALEGDTYCLACGAWESLGRELQAPWGLPGIRAIVTDLIVRTTRQVRALRNFCVVAGDSAGKEPGGKGAHSQVKQEQEERPALVRKRPHRVPPVTPSSPKRSKREERKSSSYSEESDKETEDEKPDATHKPLASGSDNRPPEPEGPPSGQVRLKEPQPVQQSQPAGRDRAGHRSEKEKHSRRRRRGGRKHQRLHRLAEDPLLRVHRALPSRYFDQLAEDVGRGALEHLWWWYRHQNLLTKVSKKEKSLFWKTLQHGPCSPPLKGMS